MRTEGRKACMAGRARGIELREEVAKDLWIEGVQGLWWRGWGRWGE